MFTNFIYFIVVLLIYATYQPGESTNFPPVETALLFVVLTIFFVAISRLSFRQLLKHGDATLQSISDKKFSATQLRLSILAIVLYGAQVYLLNIPDFISKIPVMGGWPTFQALICMALFVGYQSIAWWAAHDLYRRLYPSALPMGKYILSNISFSVPVLLPWFVLSAISDILYALPFEFLKRILSSTAGELSYILIFLAAISILGPVMIQKFWRCSPLPAGFERSLIENACRRAGVGYREIVEWPVLGGHMITAGVMGLVRRFRYILVTRGLLANLTPHELEAVMAHEIGHVKKRHLLFYLLFFTGYILISYAAFDIIIYAVLYSKPILFIVSAFGSDSAAAAPVLLSATMILFFLIYFRFIFGYFMRNFERQADSYAFSTMGTATPLISTFRKIAFTSGQDADKPNWHHFSIRQRIDFLESCERDGYIADRHDRKVSRSITVFLFFLIAMGVAGYQLNFGSGGKTLTALFLEEVIQGEIEKTPYDPELFSLLGDLHYSRNDFKNTVDAYEHALSLDFDLPGVLNNLAWLYATCVDESFRNPERALLLSKKAVALEPSAESLDTLGESLFVNGYFHEAIEASKRALEMADHNREYYEDQLERFLTRGDQ